MCKLDVKLFNSRRFGKLGSFVMDTSLSWVLLGGIVCSVVLMLPALLLDEATQQAFLPLIVLLPTTVCVVIPLLFYIVVFNSGRVSAELIIRDNQISLVVDGKSLVSATFDDIRLNYFTLMNGRFFRAIAFQIVFIGYPQYRLMVGVDIPDNKHNLRWKGGDKKRLATVFIKQVTMVDEENYMGVAKVLGVTDDLVCK